MWADLCRHLQVPIDQQRIQKIDHLATGVADKRLTLGRWLLARQVNKITWERRDDDMDHIADVVALSVPGRYALLSIGFLQAGSLGRMSLVISCKR